MVDDLATEYDLLAGRAAVLWQQTLRADAGEARHRAAEAAYCQTGVWCGHTYAPLSAAVAFGDAYRCADAAAQRVSDATTPTWYARLVCMAKSMALALYMADRHVDALQAVGNAIVVAEEVCDDAAQRTVRAEMMALVELIRAPSLHQTELSSL